MRARLGALLPFVAVLPLLLVLDRAVAIDDGAYLSLVDHILRVDAWAPLAASRFEELRAHPPGFAYWLAAAQVVSGDRELWLHLSVLPFTIAAVMAGIRLARRFAAGSPWATAMWLASPAFLVSASTLSPDVATLALSLWGLALYIEGVDGDSAGRRRVGALVAGAAMLVKYPAALVVVMLALYPVMAGPPQRRRAALIDLWPAVIPMAMWSVVNLLVDDQWHVTYASSMAAIKQPFWKTRNAIATVTVLALALVFPIGAIVARRRTLLMWLGVAAAVGVAAALVAPLAWSGLPATTAIVTGVVVAIGTASLFGLARQAGTGGRDDRFLAMWVVIQLVFLFTTWSVAVRYFLAALPPLALLVTRAMLRDDSGVPGPRRVLAALTIVTFALGIAVLHADMFWVDQQRQSATWAGGLARERGQQAFIKGGAWGFEYYARRAGLRYFGREHADRPGDLLVAMRDAPTEAITAAELARLEHFADFWSAAPPLRLHVMNTSIGAGFYASLFGPLPIMMSSRPAAGIVVWRVRGDAAKTTLPGR